MPEQGKQELTALGIVGAQRAIRAGGKQAAAVRREGEREDRRGAVADVQQRGAAGHVVDVDLAVQPRQRDPRTVR